MKLIPVVFLCSELIQQLLSPFLALEWCRPAPSGQGQIRSGQLILPSLGVSTRRFVSSGSAGH